MQSIVKCDLVKNISIDLCFCKIDSLLKCLISIHSRKQLFKELYVIVSPMRILSSSNTKLTKSIGSLDNDKESSSE